MGQARSSDAGAGRARVGVLLSGALAVVAAVGLTVALWWPTATGEADEVVEEFMHVHGLDLPAWDADAAYVSTHHGLIRIGDDDVWRWVGEQRHDFMGFTAHPTEEGTLYSSGHPQPGSDLPDPLGFMVSSDGGDTWEPRALTGEVDFHAMAAGSHGEVVYGWNVAGEAGLYRSRDSGHSWQKLPAAELHQLGGVTTLAVSLDDPEQVWAGTQPGLLRSDDAGDTWEPVHASGPVTAIAFDPADVDRALAYLAAPDEGLLETNDGGQSWPPLDLALGEDDAVTHLTIHPDEPDVVYAGTMGEDVLRSLDGGQTWDVLAESGEPRED